MLHILVLYEKIRAFSGGEILEPKQTLVAGGICSRRENCWQETRQQHVARFEDHLFSLEMRGCYGVLWGRLEIPVEIPVGPGQQFFSGHKNDPLKTETRRRARAPQRSSKIRAFKMVFNSQASLFDILRFNTMDESTTRNHKNHL